MEPVAIQLTFLEDAPAYLRGEQLLLPFDTIQVELRGGGIALLDGTCYDIADMSWRLNPTGYAVHSLSAAANGGKAAIVTMHYMVASRAFKRWKREMVIDHINGNRLDNRTSNLRIVTRSVNIHNQPARGASGCKGVRWNGYSWFVEFRVQNGWKSYGSYPTRELACAKSAEVVREIYGIYARTD